MRSSSWMTFSANCFEDCFHLLVFASSILVNLSFPLTLEEKLLHTYTNYAQLYIIIIVVQFYPWIILVSFVPYSLSYIFIPKNTGKNLNWSIKQKNKNTVHVWPKEKIDHWLTQSCTRWLFLLKRFELSVGYSLLPHQHTPPPPPSGMSFNINIVIKEDHCQPY